MYTVGIGPADIHHAIAISYFCADVNGSVLVSLNQYIVDMSCIETGEVTILEMSGLPSVSSRCRSFIHTCYAHGCFRSRWFRRSSPIPPPRQRKHPMPLVLRWQRTAEGGDHLALLGIGILDMTNITSQ